MVAVARGLSPRRTKTPAAIRRMRGDVLEERETFVNICVLVSPLWAWIHLVCVCVCVCVCVWIMRLLGATIRSGTSGLLDCKKKKRRRLKP